MTEAHKWLSVLLRYVCRNIFTHITQSEKFR